jgi:hypothetical protein
MDRNVDIRVPTLSQDREGKKHAKKRRPFSFPSPGASAMLVGELA